MLGRTGFGMELAVSRSPEATKDTKYKGLRVYEHRLANLADVGDALQMCRLVSPNLRTGT